MIDQLGFLMEGSRKRIAYPIDPLCNEQDDHRAILTGVRRAPRKGEWFINDNLFAEKCFIDEYPDEVWLCKRIRVKPVSVRYENLGDVDLI